MPPLLGRHSRKNAVPENGVASMKARLTIRRASGALEEYDLETGQEIRIGRTSRAQLVFPDDVYLSSSHLAINCLDEECRVRDLGSRTGTYVNDQLLGGAILKPGDIIRAGATFIQVSWDPPPPAPALPAFLITSEEEREYPESTLRLLSELRRRNVFALLDAARDPLIYPTLETSREEFCCLYNGKSAQTLQLQAPYLVRPNPEGSLLRFLARFAWGKNWGVYLASERPITELRKHLRRFLMVEDPQGRPVYFRYYDPRVLRVFLPKCLPEEMRDFFGPVQAYFVESEQGDSLLEFRSGVTGRPAEVHPIQRVETRRA
jgi:hypothetical protein